MKKSIFILVGFIIMGCGKVQVRSGNTTITVDTSLVNSAAADIVQCAAGMTLVPTSPGVAAFCIDDTPSGTGALVTHVTALQNCAIQAKALCSTPQLVYACTQGTANVSYTYWASEISGTPSMVALTVQGSNCASPGASGVSNTRSYYCCSH